MIPVRETACPAYSPGFTRVHQPEGETVVTENNLTYEWQSGTCHHCNNLIMRFRWLRGGWFDKWGSLILNTLELERWT